MEDPEEVVYEYNGGTGESYRYDFPAKGGVRRIVTKKKEHSVPDDAKHVRVNPSVKKIDERAFEDFKSLESITIPEGVESIGFMAFKSCKKLKSIEFPSTLKEIGSIAFSECKSLESLKFNEGLEIIGLEAFEYCRGLQFIQFPLILKIIKEDSFRHCTSLESVKFNEGLEIIEPGAFENCKGLQFIHFPSTLKTIKKRAFRYCESLESLKFNEGLEIIGPGAFDLCKGLQFIHFPSTLKIIEEEAFCHCESLESLKLNEGLEIIGPGAFSYCKSLHSIQFSSTLETMQEGVFKKEGLKKGVFYKCQQIQNIDFPSNWKTMPLEVLEECPNVSVSNVNFTPEISKAEKEPIQGNTILHQLLEYKFSYSFIESFLQGCPSAIRETNILGQTPLHLCIINRHSVETTKMVYTRWPEALSSRNEVGKNPLDYWEEMGSDKELGSIFSVGGFVKEMLPNPACYLKDNEWIPLEMDGILRYQRLMFEIPETNNERLQLRDTVPSNESLRRYFYRELSTRHMLFGKLLKEFANLIEFDDKMVIQRAAALEALCGEGLMSQCKTVYVDFKAFSSSAMWYQQEILKLVLRVYHEDQAHLTFRSYNDHFHPSTINDAEHGRDAMINGAKPVSKHRKETFTTLVDWLVDKLEAGDYELKGPVLKPLQSLFNKMYIRRGQTKVSIVGDMTRATLIIKDESDFFNLVGKIEKKFPDILQFASPDNIGIVEFMNRVHKMKKVPKSQIIPYRFKPNGSQKKKETKRLYNLNFFDTVPEYHRVGNTEIFVAFELQIGLEAELDSLPDHNAYEKDRILKGQKLLDMYIKSTGDSTPSPLLVDEKESESDFKIMENIIEGNFSNHRWRALEDVEFRGKNRLFLNRCINLKGNVFRKLQRSSKLGGIYCWNPALTTARLCLNNKSINMWMEKGNAIVLDRITSLDSFFQYSVKSLSIRWNPPSSYGWYYNRSSISLYVGLFAHVGPYMVNLASRRIDDYDTEHDVHIVKPQVNFEMLEKVTPLPSGCDTVLLIFWGKYKLEDPNWCCQRREKRLSQLRKDCYDGMELVLEKYEKLE